MIENNALRKHILLYFLRNSNMDLDQMTELISKHLQHNFVTSETVLVKSSETYGRVVKADGNNYTVSTDSKGAMHEENLQWDDLLRSDILTPDVIKEFLCSVSKLTPFGRVLKEGVFPRAKQSSLSVSKKSTKPKSESQHTLPQMFNVESAKKAVAEDCVSEEAVEQNKKQKKTTKEVDKPLDSYLGKESKVVVPVVKPTEFLLRKTYSISSNSSIKIGNLQSSSLDLFFKIYVFIKTFRNELGLPNIDMNQLVEFLVDSTLDSDFLYKLFVKLVGDINKEMYSSEMISCMQISLNCIKAEYSGDISISSRELKIFTKENWKQEVVKFLENQSKLLQSPKVLVFCQVFSSKHRNVDLTMNFIEFLMEVFYRSTSFREILSSQLQNYKAQDRKKNALSLKIKDMKNRYKETEQGEERVKILNEINVEEAKLMKLNRTLLFAGDKVKIGKIDSHELFVVDGQIYANKSSKYARLTIEDIQTIGAEASSLSKGEKNVLKNLKLIADTLYFKEKLKTTC